jgi:hypothetical protein
MKEQSGEHSFLKYSKVAVPGDNIFLRQVFSLNLQTMQPGRPFCASGGGHWVK